MRNLRNLYTVSWLRKARRPISLGALAALFIFQVNTYAQNAKPPETTASIPTPTEIAQSGVRVGSAYRNPLLQFSISVPPQWNFASDEMNKKLLSDGKAKLKENETKARQEQFEKSIGNSVVLFSLTQSPPGDARITGHLACGYERVSATALAYARSNKDLLLTKSPGARLIKDIYSLKIGGADVQAFDLGSTPNGVNILQVYYVVARHGGILFCVTSWLEGADEQGVALDAIVRSSKFDQK
jgi:hypothetical protein